MSFSCCNSSAKLLHFKTKCSAENGLLWSQMAVAVTYTFQAMYNLEHDFSNSRYNNHLMVVLFQPSTTEAASNFMSNLSNLLNDVVYISIILEDNAYPSECFDKIIDLFRQNLNNINTVAVFTEEIKTVESLIEVINITTDLKLTRILHTTEWVIVSTKSYQIPQLQKVLGVVIDFITFLFKGISQDVYVAQKSRNKALYIKAKVSGFNTMSNPDCTYEFISNTASYLFKLVKKEILRKHAMAFLHEQKSIISGFHLRAAILDIDVAKLAVRDHHGNVTTIHGYAAALMETMASSLDFTYSYVVISDGGSYGTINKNGSSSGIIGLLDTKSAEITTLPLSRTGRRLQDVDFVPVMTLRDTIYLIYRVPESDNDIDLIYFNIVKPDVIFSLLGPALILALIGALAHVATLGCTSAVPQCPSRNRAGNLLSYTENICFHTSRTYPGQTGRVLRTTWALFWFIICSAYSAFLVTTFTIKPAEVPINTFKKLAEAKEFNIGSLSTASAFLNLISTSKNASIRGLSTRLTLMNEKDNMTFSADVKYHAKKVMEQRYAFVAGFCVSLGHCDDIFQENIRQIRAYVMSIDELPDDSYTALPKNAFYADDLYIVSLKMQEAGILQYLQRFHFKARLMGKSEAQKFNEKEQAVSFSRISLPIYTALAGVSMGIVILAMELLYHRLTKYRKGSILAARSHQSKLADSVSRM